MFTRNRLQTCALVATSFSLAIATGCSSDESQESPAPTPDLSPAATPSLSAAEEAAWVVYDPKPFRKIRMTGSLVGDDFTGMPLTDAVNVCGTPLRVAEHPVVPQAAMSYLGGGFTYDDSLAVTRSIALYLNADEAQSVYDVIADDAATCATESLPIKGALAWVQPASATTATDSADTAVWTLTLDGRVIFMQHKPVPNGSTLTEKTHVADELLKRAEPIRTDLGGPSAP